jgi:hypothetical protein
MVHAAIPELRRLKQEDSTFKASLVYIVRPCLRAKKKSLEISLEHLQDALGSITAPQKKKKKLLFACSKQTF